MKLWRWFISFLNERHAPCAWCHVRVEFTGGPARTPVEALILKITKGRRHASFHWLEGQLAEALYAEELRKGAWATDIGIWGPAVFRREASEVLRDLRPEFGVFQAEGETSQSLVEAQRNFMSGPRWLDQR